MKDIILIGAGGHAKSCIDVIELENKFKILGLIDLKKRVGEEVLGYKIIDSDENLSKYVSKNTYFLITLGQIKSAQRRIEIFKNLVELKANIATVISPLAYISKYSTIKKGTIVMHGAIINANVTIGKNCIINTRSLIEHDAIIEDNCHISTSSTINGCSIIKKESFIGSNSVIVHNKMVENNSFIKAGSLVK